MPPMNTMMAIGRIICKHASKSSTSQSRMPKPSKVDLAAAGSSTGEPYEKYQNRKGRKSAEKQESRKALESASKHAAHLQSSSAASTPPRPRTRSQNKKSGTTGSKRGRERSLSKSRGSKSTPPPAKASQKGQTSQSEIFSDGESPEKRKKKRKRGKGGQSDDQGSKDKSTTKLTLSEAASRSRTDPAMQHRSPLQPPHQEPIRDELDWNKTGSLRAYHLSKRAANPNRELSLPGHATSHVPGMIKTSLISLTEVVKNPKLLERPLEDSADKGKSSTSVAPPSGSRRLIVGVDPLPNESDPPEAVASSSFTDDKRSGGKAQSKGKTLPKARPAKPWVYELDPGTGTTEPFYYIDGIPRPYFGWSYPDQMVGRKLGCSEVRAMDQPQEHSEFLGGRAEQVLQEWQSVLDETDRPLDQSVLSNYDEMVKCYDDLNSHVEKRRQDIVNCEGYAQNIIARGETLLVRFHRRAMAELTHAHGVAFALEHEKAELKSRVEHQSRELDDLRAELHGYQVKITAHNAVASDYHKMHADLENMRQRNIKLDSDLEDLREENDRLKRENDLLSAGLTWAEKAEYSAKAESSQVTPSTSTATSSRAPIQLPRQPIRSEPLAGPSRETASMASMTEAMIPILKDNISQMVADAIRQHVGVTASADKAHIAKLELRLTQLSTPPLAPSTSIGSNLPPCDSRSVAKAMQSSPAQLEHMLPLPVGFSPLRQSETQTSTSLAESEESDGTGVTAISSPVKPAIVTKITRCRTNEIVAVFDDKGNRVEQKAVSPTASSSLAPDESAMETDTDTDAPTTSNK